MAGDWNLNPHQLNNTGWLHKVRGRVDDQDQVVSKGIVLSAAGQCCRAPGSIGRRLSEPSGSMCPPSGKSLARAGATIKEGGRHTRGEVSRRMLLGTGVGKGKERGSRATKQEFLG